MNKLISGIKGFIIGAANIVPGISSGTLMVIFNIYDRFVDAANLFFKHPFKAIWSIIDILIGFVIGLAGSFLLVSYLYESFPVAITFLILGLIFGGFKPIIDKTKDKVSLANTIILILSAAVIIILPLFAVRETIHEGAVYYIVLIILGLVVAFAAVAPGISGSLMLVIFGYYKHILEIGKAAFKLILKGQFKDSLPYLLPFILLAVSILIGLVVSIKLIKRIMDKYETLFYYSVLGMLVGSPAAILIILNKQVVISERTPLEWIGSTVLLLAGFFIVFFMIKIEDVKNKNLLEQKEEQVWYNN